VWISLRWGDPHGNDGRRGVRRQRSRIGILLLQTRAGLGADCSSKYYRDFPVATPSNPFRAEDELPTLYNFFRQRSALRTHENYEFRRDNCRWRSGGERWRRSGMLVEAAPGPGRRSLPDAILRSGSASSSLRNEELQEQTFPENSVPRTRLLAKRGG